MLVPACDAGCRSKRLCVRADHVSDVYAEMRRDEAAAQMPHSYTTARTLMSILRLSQGLARLRFADSVAQVRRYACTACSQLIGGAPAKHDLCVSYGCSTNDDHAA